MGRVLPGDADAAVVLGSVVNASSTAGLVGIPGHAAYGAGRFGLRGLSRSAARALCDARSAGFPRPEAGAAALRAAARACRSLAARPGATVVSVGYRRAPEHRFPAVEDDVWTALDAAAAWLTSLV